MGISEPLREGFVTAMEAARRDGPSRFTTEELLRHAKKAGAVANCESLKWWISSGVMVGLAQFDLIRAYKAERNG